MEWHNDYVHPLVVCELAYVVVHGSIRRNRDIVLDERVAFVLPLKVQKGGDYAICARFERKAEEVVTWSRGPIKGKAARPVSCMSWRAMTESGLERVCWLISRR